MISLKPVTIDLFPGSVTVDRAITQSVEMQLWKPIEVRTASGNVVLGTEVDGKFVGSLAKQSSMTPEQYAAWGTDDAYATEVLCINLGLEPV
jgi:hypothetical protein